MLSIVKKGEIKSKPTTTLFKSEKEVDCKIKDLLASGKEIVFSEVQNIYQWVPSINAETLAHLVHDILHKMTRQNYQQSINLILFLYETPHEEEQFRYHLKTKFKVDPVVFLLALYEKRDKPIVLKLVATIVDSYTLALMLNGKEALSLWKSYTAQLRSQYQSLEDIKRAMAKLQERGEKGEQKEEQKGEAFRRVVIPL